MGMGVKHFRFYGTKEEIEDVKQTLHKRPSTDRVLEDGPLFSHMNNVLGVEIYCYCVSKIDFSHMVYESIQKLLAKYPNLLYAATWKDGRIISNGLETFTNFAHEDIEYPGPFGALCKVYGHNYYDETAEQKQMRIENWHKSQAMKETE